MVAQSKFGETLGYLSLTHVGFYLLSLRGAMWTMFMSSWILFANRGICKLGSLSSLTLGLT